MKPEIASALYDYENICKFPFKYTPKQLKELEKELAGYIIPKEWVIIECIGSASHFFVDEGGRANIYGGVYKVTDQIINVEFTLDMDRGVMINGKNEEVEIGYFNALNNAFICDYSDFPHSLYPKDKWENYKQ